MMRDPKRKVENVAVLRTQVPKTSETGRRKWGKKVACERGSSQILLGNLKQAHKRRKEAIQGACGGSPKP